MRAAIALALIATGCGLLPQKTAQDVATEDIGPAPNLDTCKQFVKATMKGVLLSPASAQYTWGGQLLRDWYRPTEFSGAVVAWRFPFTVRSNDAYGVPGPPWQWDLFLRHGHAVAMKQPMSRSAYGRGDLQQTIPFEPPIAIPGEPMPPCGAAGVMPAK